jgi:hypothetical protein
MNDATLLFDTATIPNDYYLSLEEIAPNISSLIEENGTESRPWYETLASVIPNLTATYEQKQLLDAQIERARLGLPPIGSHELNPGLSKDTIQLMIAGGVALGALLWFLSTQRGGRR